MAIPDTCGAPGSGEHLLKTLDAVGRATALDHVAEPLQRAVRGLPLGPVRDVLHGLPIGHPLHPALVQIPLGTWLSAAVLDLAGGAERPARLLTAIGVLAAAPTALSGWVDWAEQPKQQLRTGVVHATATGLAVLLQGASWVARSRGCHRAGRALGLGGLAAVSVGAALGGHLAYRQSAGTNKAEPVPELVGPEWHDLGAADDFVRDGAVRRMIGEVPVMVVRGAEGEFHVLADRCSHSSGPLSEGRIADGCVTCPWHGSVFRLSDGWNVGGPATAPQPCFLTRIDAAGRLQARLPAVV
ncbi:Rieske 2Fe-2S domain-containing protein [Kitasatospora sp. NPDC059571]|uniref:Rieske 2Fe-2S domain-containing protein n=1 Tax=Kitasatospora sp. NPDC059571 TaxID=3346871 RepID=UPI003689243B